eukprot:2370980-Prorocentrum_lima.AAC.1
MERSLAQYREEAQKLSDAHIQGDSAAVAQSRRIREGGMWPRRPRGRSHQVPLVAERLPERAPSARDCQELA